ncbi:p53 and DNA damage-regulated protein 1-like [Ptychodera flava]|uniref:p53 and DNA damage-regulated protein 1-like n=1 Tax=Ptychodera flava TaxID=63121 RepID=UPI00396A6482
MDSQAKHGTPEFVLNYLGQVEELAEEILTDKQTVVDLDRKRNKNREAIRALGKVQPTPGKADKTWVCFGNMFLKIPRADAKNLLEKDQKELDTEIDKIRKGLKPKVSKLHDMEGRPDIKGFNLNALSKDELHAVRH